MKRKLPRSFSPIAPAMTRGLPAGAGFAIAGIGSCLFFALLAGIAAIV